MDDLQQQNNTEKECIEIPADFDDFVKELDPEKAENNLKEFNVDNMIEEEGKCLICPYCKWSGHKNAKDKKRGLKNHLKKCKKNPDNEDFDINPVQQKQDKKDFKINIKKNEIDYDQYDELTIDEEEDLNNEEARLKILSDLDILKLKFSGINFKWNYNSSSSINILIRQKALFLRVLNDEAGTEALLKLLVISSSALEKAANITSVCDLEGYAEDVNGARGEIYPILKNLVDTGVVSVEHLSPEMRLGMVMISLGINRIEKNRIGRNSSFLGQSEVEQEFL